MTKRSIPVRNTVALSPLLRKGGPHTKSKTGQRVRSRLSTNSAIDDWYDDIEDNETQQDENGEQTLPIFLSGHIRLTSSHAHPRLLTH